jgi:eukaryotic-like serine/threonine-protein kinase
VSEPDERIQSTLSNKYRVLRFIAEGGMGAVYEAQHLLVRRRFAVKFLRRDLTHRRDVLTRFTREAQAAGALESENIAAVIDFGIAGDGTPYLVMEYLEGEDLGQLLAREGPLPAERAADLVLQAALGAQMAHEAGIIHRDLKPQNLFVCRRADGSDLVKLLDFGVAKIEASDAQAAVTRTGSMLGTPAYMSPEQARGETALDARTDVYALGVILYEALSKRTPHPGDSHNAVLHHIATLPALPLPTVGRDVPRALVELVGRTLCQSVSDRPASAAAFASELRPLASRKVWEPAPSSQILSDVGSAATLHAPSPELEPAGHGSPDSSSGGRRLAPTTSGRFLRPVALGLMGVLAVLVFWVARVSLAPTPEFEPPRERPISNAPRPVAAAAVSAEGSASSTASSESPVPVAPVAPGIVPAAASGRPPRVAKRPVERPAPDQRQVESRPAASGAAAVNVILDSRNPYQ